MSSEPLTVAQELALTALTLSAFRHHAQALATLYPIESGQDELRAAFKELERMGLVLPLEGGHVAPSSAGIHAIVQRVSFVEILRHLEVKPADPAPQAGAEAQGGEG